MNRIKQLQAVATIFVTLGIIFILGVESNVAYGVLSVLCFLGGAGFNDLANLEKTIVDNQLWEGTGND